MGGCCTHEQQVDVLWTERQSWFFTTSFGSQTVRMKRVVVILLPLLGLLHAGPLPDEPVLQPQENFDVNRVSYAFWMFKKLIVNRLVVTLITLVECFYIVSFHIDTNISKMP